MISPSSITGYFYYSFSSFLVFLLFFYCCFFSTTPSSTTSLAHVCLHDEPFIQQPIRKVNEEHEIKMRQFQRQKSEESEWLNSSGDLTPTKELVSIRFHADFSNLNNNMMCTKIGEQRPSPKTGLMVTCTELDIPPPDVVEILSTKVMPVALERLSRALKVVKTEGKLRVTSNQCRNRPSMTVPAQHITKGVENVDYIIYVTAGPIGNRDTLAFAAYCERRDDGRPVVGYANFNPYHIKWDKLDPSFNNSGLLETAVHEVIHALGFTNPLLDEKSIDTQYRGKTVKAVNSPKVLEVGKEYFNCDTLKGVEREDEGGSGSQGSHWERRIVFEELMCASGGHRLSAFTLAFLEDTGYYYPDYKEATLLQFGRNSSCSFIEDKCDTKGGGFERYWCSSANKENQCTFDHRGFGICSSGRFTDDCSYFASYKNRHCDFISPDPGDLPGMYYGEGGRCFVTDKLRKSFSTSSIPENLRCLRARCPANGTRLEIGVDGNQWVLCPMDGTAADVNAPRGYEGKISCPAAIGFCDRDVTVGTNIREELPPLGSPELPSSPNDSRFTIEVFLNGKNWSFAFSRDIQRILLYNAIRIDIGKQLTTGTISIAISRLRLINERNISVMIRLINDDMQALTADVVGLLLNGMIGKPEMVPTVEQAYRISTGGMNYKNITITGYVINEPQSSSICSSKMTPDTCIMVIGCVTAVVVTIIMLIIIYCVCLKSPFKHIPKVVKR